MGLQRKVHSAGFKAKVALAAHKADRTVNQLAGQYDVHPTQIHAWKKQLLAGAEAIFANGTKAASADAEAREAELSEQIGRLKMELEWMIRDVRMGRPDQVWSADITYIPMASGFMYLAATIDWFSRYVVAWRLSNTLDGSFCLEMLDEALGRGRPEVFNTDQGVQFTAEAFTGRMESSAVAVSMDGRGGRWTTCSSSGCGGR